MQQTTWQQNQIKLPAFQRGFHLITASIEPHVPNFQAGLLHLMLLHTSASLTINENACADVRWEISIRTVARHLFR